MLRQPLGITYLRTKTQSVQSVLLAFPSRFFLIAPILRDKPITQKATGKTRAKWKSLTKGVDGSQRSGHDSDRS